MLDIESALTCSSCGKRPARYLRRQSGERLCTVCLRRDLYKEVKRSFSMISRKSIGIRIGVIVEPCRLIESVVLARILSEVEKEFCGYVIGVLPADSTMKCLHYTRKYFHELVFVNVLGETLKDRLDIDQPLDMRLDVIALPKTLNDMLILFLRHLAYEYKIERPKPYMKYQALEILVPMYRVPRSDILAYALLDGILAEFEYCVEATIGDTLDRLVTQLSLEHPELLYRFLHSIMST